MKKTLVAALAALVMTAGYAGCKEEVPPYLVVEDIDEDGIQGKAVVGVTDPEEVPTHMTIPNGIVAIGEFAFEDCTSIESLTLPKSVKKIGAGAFSNCESLASVVIPDGVTAIGRMAFYGCTSLASISIPSSVRRIAYEAFEDCDNLRIQYDGTMEQWNAIQWYWY